MNVRTADIKKMKIRLVICIILSLFLQRAFSFDRDYSKGPFYGKNMYVPFLIYYNFPGFRATEGTRYEFTYHFSSYYNQDFSAYRIYNKGRYYDVNDIARDYEGLVVETGSSFFIFKNLEAGVDMRLVSYYPGFLDEFIESYHGAFGFPNGGRDAFSRNRLYVNLPNDNGISLFLSEPAVSFGDIDLWIKYTFFQRKMLALALAGALKIPSGSIDKLSGSGYPDIGVQLLVDFKPFWVLTFYVQAGFVLPFDTMIRYSSKPDPMYNGLLGLELNPLNFFSLLVQLNVKSSPIIRGQLKNSWIKSVDQLSLPQVNTLFGFKFRYKQLTWQFYFEEDTFTNQGTDFTVNAMFSQAIFFGRL
jgi:hypothetical protein